MKAGEIGGLVKSAFEVGALFGLPTLAKLKGHIKDGRIADIKRVSNEILEDAKVKAGDKPVDQFVKEAKAELAKPPTGEELPPEGEVIMPKMKPELEGIYKEVFDSLPDEIKKIIARLLTLNKSNEDTSSKEIEKNK